jgi:hypothetical protein
MLTGFGSYCDEFGHPKDPNKKVMGIAGLLGWSDDWIALSNRWRKIQDAEQVPTFHMTDFVHHTEDFSDKRWESEDERARILTLFLDAIETAKVIPVSASVALTDFNELTEDQRTRLVSPYHIAFQEVTFNIAFAAANKAMQSAKSTQEFFGNRAAMVYAKLKKFTGPAKQLWDAIKEFNPAAGNWMSSYTPGEPSDYPPLQAADMWAYSLGHMIEHKPPKKKEAEIAFNFFVHAATSPDQALGHRFYTHFDRNELLTRLGETPKLAGDN